MRDMDNLCMNCFKTLTEGPVCTRCGYDNEKPNETFCLPQKDIVGGRYVVGAFVKRESDAVTYMGYDPQIKKNIIIREYCPKNFANRLEGSHEIHVRQRFVDEYKKHKQTFIKLWQTLQKLQSLSAVVPVYDVFEENGTAYAIIENLESIPLREYLLRNENGYIQWDSARIMFMPILTTIEALHNEGIIHGSITPDNLVLCRDGKVRLTPFTILPCCDASTDFEFNHTDGYTALEQYDNKHRICPSTDIYAFCACIYRTLVGTNPPDAISREANDKLMIPNSIAETIPIHVIKALGSGLQIYPEKRVKNVTTFRDELDASPVVQAKAAEPVRKVVTVDDEALKMSKAHYEELVKNEPIKKNNKSKIAIIFLIVLIAISIAAGIYVIKITENQQNTTVATSDVIYQTYEVPNFTNNGYTQSDIQNNGAWNEQFKITFNYEYSTEVEAGIICAQSISAGETVNAGTNIVLTVSKGVQTEEIPNVNGLMLEDAKKMLEEKGFKVSSVEVYNDGTHLVNQLKSAFAISPAEGSIVALGTEVIIQVYGEGPTTTQEISTTENESTSKPTSDKVVMN